MFWPLPAREANWLPPWYEIENILRERWRDVDILFLSTYDATRIRESMARARTTLPSVSSQRRIAQWLPCVPWLG